MKELVESFNIFLKYSTAKYPTHCENDVMYVLVDPEIVSPEDIEELEEKGFIISEEFECFMSYRYGSS